MAKSFKVSVPWSRSFMLDPRVDSWVFFQDPPPCSLSGPHAHRSAAQPPACSPRSSFATPNGGRGEVGEHGGHIGLGANQLVPIDRLVASKWGSAYADPDQYSTAAERVTERDQRTHLRLSLLSSNRPWRSGMSRGSTLWSELWTRRK